jgi:hypothetical protein
MPCCNRVAERGAGGSAAASGIDDPAGGVAVGVGDPGGVCAGDAAKGADAEDPAAWEVGAEGPASSVGDEESRTCGGDGGVYAGAEPEADTRVIRGESLLAVVRSSSR